MTTATDTTDRLVRRLNLAADELASAARFGLPVPTSASVNGYAGLEGLTLSLDSVDEFDAWADYASDVIAEDYEHDGARWQRATGTLGLEGLRVSFAVRLPLLAEVCS